MDTVPQALAETEIQKDADSVTRLYRKGVRQAQEMALRIWPTAAETQEETRIHSGPRAADASRKSESMRGIRPKG
jgi:hypothetical protein